MIEFAVWDTKRSTRNFIWHWFIWSDFRNIVCKQAAPPPEAFPTFLAALMSLPRSLLNKGDFGFCISSNVSLSSRSCNRFALENEAIGNWIILMIRFNLDRSRWKKTVSVSVVFNLQPQARASHWKPAPHRGDFSSPRASLRIHHLSHEGSEPNYRCHLRW